MGDQDMRCGGAPKGAPKLTIETEPDLSSTEETDTKASSEASLTGAEAIGFIKGLGSILFAYANTHRFTVLYACIGFVLAVLVLLIGLWNTIVIAVFSGVGAIIGQIRDGDNGIVNFFRRLFSNGR